MRAGLRIFVPLLLCAAAGAAALAHVAIDVVGDYALPHDTYDHIAHDSRNLIAGLALVAAMLIAVRGLRLCCDLAAADRGRLPGGNLSWRAILAFVGIVTAAATVLVPVMELLDARLDGIPLDGFADAFGGSVLLGVAVTIVCALLVAGAVLALAAWILAHRAAIETIVVWLLGRDRESAVKNARARRRSFVRLRHPALVFALRLCKRGPPRVARFSRQHVIRTPEGDPRASTASTRSASVARVRHRVVPGVAGRRPAQASA